MIKDQTKRFGLTSRAEGYTAGEVEKRVSWTLSYSENYSGAPELLRLITPLWQFIQRFSRITAPRISLTREGKGIKDWDEQFETTFEAFVSKPIPAHIVLASDWSLPPRCYVEACQVAVGGTLTKNDKTGGEHVISYLWKSLYSAEENYAANDREILRNIYFLKRFRCRLEGNPFEGLIDHQVLKSSFTKVNLSRRESRWLECLGQFGICSFTLMEEEINVVGDELSQAFQVVKEDNKAPSVVKAQPVQVEAPDGLQHNS